MKRLILCACIVLLAGTGWGDDYYVRPTNGNDLSDGKTFATAFKTTQKAVDSATAPANIYLCAEADETITAAIDVDTNAGTNTAPIIIYGASSSGDVDGTRYTITTSNNINILTFTSTADYTVWNGVIFSGNTGSDGITIPSGSNNHRFINCDFKNASDGAYAAGSVVSFYNCNFFSNSASGLNGIIFVHGGTSHDNGSHGIQCQAANGNILDVIIYDNGGDGINLNTNSDNSYLSSLTIYGNDSDGIDCHAASDFCFFYNISSVGNAAYGFNFNSMDADNIRYFDYNHTHLNTSAASDITLPASNNITGDPLFVSVVDGSEDFTPNTGSPLIRAGINYSDIGAVAHAACEACPDTPTPYPTCVPTETPVDTPTQTPTMTETPTMTPEPTWTPLPTYTPEPTYTPGAGTGGYMPRPRVHGD